MADKVLMLSGDARLLDMYKRLLAKRGFGFKGVPTADKALQFLKEKKPVAFIADRATPKEDVFDLLARKKRLESIRSIPVYVLSHVSDSDDVARARALGVASYALSLHTHPSRVVDRIVAQVTKH